MSLSSAFTPSSSELQKTIWLQFKYDARLTLYLLMGAFKLGAMLLFFIPWLVLRLGRASKVVS